MNELAQIEIELNYNYGFSWFIKNNIFVKGYVFNEAQSLHYLFEAIKRSKNEISSNQYLLNFF